MNSLKSLEWVQYCPHCGHSLQATRSLLNGYSEADASICFWWCHTCEAKGEIKQIEGFTAPELVED